MRKALLAAAIAGLSIFGLSASNAQADSILVGGFSATPSGSNETFEYDMILVGPSTARTTDFFVIFDFRGYTGVHSEPAGWTLTTELLTGPITGSNGTLTIADSATILNLHWTRTGANIVGAQPLGTFKAETNIPGNSTKIGELGARDFSNLLKAPRTNEDLVPVPVPLPAAALSGMALLGALGAARMRKAK